MARRLVSFVTALALLAFSLIAACAPNRACAQGKINTNDSAYALGGYDVVAYFTDGKPVRGAPAISQTYRGAHWLFASPAHRDLFLKMPEKYLPRYDGYCAYGVSNGNLVKIDPQAFTIRNGVLYLNYSLPIRTEWLRDVDARIRKADKLFPGLAH